MAEAEYLDALRAAAAKSIDDIDSRHWGPSGAEIADKESEEILRGWSEHRKSTLRASLDRPYSGRVDLDSGGALSASTYYVGNTGIQQSETRARLVVDWRAQIATAFYRPGPEVCLKRRFEIQAGELVEIFDDVVEPGAGREADPALIQILAGSRGHELRPIVATIQAEQDKLIRAEDKFLLIQGGAGTGKTVVALHRLAYLLYTDRVETRRQKELRVAVFGPNRLFLGYVASVLPSLGESNVFHTTFEDWFTRWCGHQAINLPAWDDALDTLIAQAPQPPGERSTQVAARSHLKGSLRMGKLLERFVDEQRAEVLARLRSKPLAFDVVQGYGMTLRLSVSPSDHERITREAQSQPLNRGREWVRQWAWQRLRVQLDRRYGPVVGDGSRAPQALANSARRAFEATLEHRWPTIQFKRTYQKLMSDHFRLAELATGIFEPAELSLLHTAKLDVDDLGPLAYARLLVDGLARVRDARGHETEQIQRFDHLVVDEAQDLAPLQLAVLRAHTDGATVLGDIAQGVNPFRGMRDWNEIEDLLHAEHGAARQVNLSQSYRSTEPIIEFANQIWRRWGQSS